MNDVIIYKIKINEVSAKYKKYFTENKIYKMKYIASACVDFIYSDEKKWIFVTNEILRGLVYTLYTKDFKVKSNIFDKLTIGETHSFITSYDNRYVLYRRKIYEVNKNLIPV